MATRARGKVTKIKPPKKHGPTISIEETWDKLSTNLVEILKNRTEHLSYEENHRHGYNMVLYKSGEKLYKGTCDLMAKNLEDLVKEELIPTFPRSGNDDALQKSQEGETLLKAMRKVWDEHISGLSKLKEVLKYMDRVYTHSAGVPEIWDAGLLLFIKHIIRPPIEKHVISAILYQIQMERDGYDINRSAVRGAVYVLLQLSETQDTQTIYKRDLEPDILRESEIFYKAEGERLIEECSSPSFLEKVTQRLESEESRAHHYLSSQSSGPLRTILETHLLTPHLSTVIAKPDSGLDFMVDHERLDDLARLYRLSKMIPVGPQTLKKALRETIIRRGMDVNSSSIVSEAADSLIDDDPETKKKSKGKGKARPNPAAQILASALKWVQDVLELKDKFDRIWVESFQSDHEVENCLTEAFESFINLHERAPEFISLFIDENLKKGLKGKTEVEVDIVLDKTITIFRYITDKDMFERYYKGHLAKRLILGRSVSDDAERGMLAKFKVECGHQFTQRMEGMFQDMKNSADTMEAYRTYLSKTTAPEVEISVIIMTFMIWPMAQNASSWVTPELLNRSLKSFEKFYLARHSGRRLTFLPSLGSADVKVTFGSGKVHELNVSTYALIILLLFEDLGDDDFLTYGEIKGSTGIEDAELQRQLQSLACAKYKVLKKHPPSRDVHENDSFSFNADFMAPLYKIKISTIVSRVESPDERKETKDRNDEDRRYQIDACIARTMKARKHMTLNDLLHECTSQLASRFHPNTHDIKRRIDALIEREILQRCDDMKSFNYLP